MVVRASRGVSSFLRGWVTRRSLELYRDDAGVGVGRFHTLFNGFARRRQPSVRRYGRFFLRFGEERRRRRSRRSVKR